MNCLQSFLLRLVIKIILLLTRYESFIIFIQMKIVNNQNLILIILFKNDYALKLKKIDLNESHNSSINLKNFLKIMEIS